jgi:hypothetical protein
MAKEGSKAIRSCGVGRIIRIGMEEARRSSVTRDLPPYRGVAVDLLLPPFVQYDLGDHASSRSGLWSGRIKQFTISNKSWKNVT